MAVNIDPDAPVFASASVNGSTLVLSYTDAGTLDAVNLPAPGTFAPTPAQLQPFIDMTAQGVTGGELAVLAGNLELNAVRIDLVGLAATGIEFA